MSITKITAITPEILTKTFSLDANGKLIKHKCGHLVRGTFEVRDIPSPSAFVNELNNIQYNQAFVFGVPLNKSVSGTIASKKAATNGDICRDRASLGFESGPGWMMLDVDAAEGLDTSIEEIYQALNRCIPNFRTTVPHVITHSASTFIYNTATDECLKGEGGKRVYVLVKQADDIPRAGKVLYQRLQATGSLHYFVAKNGVLLDRSLIDGSVFCAEKLDFCAGANLGRGLEQRRPCPIAVNDGAEPLDTGVAIKNLSYFEEKDIENLSIAKRALVEPRRAVVREQWLTENIAYRPDGVSVEEYRKVLADGADKLILDQSFSIQMEDGTRVFVSEILSNPRHWHNRTCLDPLEPEYDGGRSVGKLYLTGAQPIIHSFAHGGRKYLLNKKKHKLQVVEGHTEELTDACLSLLAGNNIMYRCEDMLCEVKMDTTPFITQPDALESHLDRQIRFFTMDKNNHPRNCDCPPKIARRMLLKQNQWQFYQLDGVVNMPVMRRDGTILDVPGYDPKSKLLYEVDPCEETPVVPMRPSNREIQEAVRRLWDPFRLFPFAEACDRGAALAAILTVPLRPVLPAAPGILVNAPAYGTGKTLFALSLGAMTGGKVSVSSWPNNVEEQRKSLASALRCGYSQIVLDNLEGNLYSADLASIFTTPTWTTRILGKTEDIKMRTNTMIVATGNNVYPIRDLCRRFCTIRINADTAHPERRVFDFSPKTLIESDVIRYRMDSLTVLRGFVEAGMPRISSDVVGSFDDWDGLVRQCVNWLVKEGLCPVEMADPMASMSSNSEEDPDQMKLSNLLTSWYDLYQSAEVTVKQLIAGSSAAKADFSSEDIDTGLDDAIEAIADDRKGNREANPRILGWFLEKHKDCISGDLQLKRSPRVRQKKVLYYLKKLA